MDAAAVVGHLVSIETLYSYRCRAVQLWVRIAEDELAGAVKAGLDRRGLPAVPTLSFAPVCEIRRDLNRKFAVDAGLRVVLDVEVFVHARAHGSANPERDARLFRPQSRDLLRNVR